MTKTERATLMAEYKALKAIPVDYSKFKPTSKNHAGAVALTTILTMFALGGSIAALSVIYEIVLPWLHGIAATIVSLPILIFIGFKVAKHLYPKMLKETYVPAGGEARERYDRIVYLDQVLFAQQRKDNDDRVGIGWANNPWNPGNFGSTNPASRSYVGRER